MNTYAIVEAGLVVNIVAWDGNSDWIPQDGTLVELLPAGSPVGIGYLFDGTNFNAPSGDTVPTLTLAQVQAAQNTLNWNAYEAAIYQPIIYTSIGKVTETYQADQDSVAKLGEMIQAFQLSGSVPTGFYWVAEDNTQVPFTYADMQGLAQAAGLRGASAFQQMQELKAQVNAATTVQAVQATVWPA